MWEEGVRIYGTPGVHNHFPWMENAKVSINFTTNLVINMICGL